MQRDEITPYKNKKLLSIISDESGVDHQSRTWNINLSAHINVRYVFFVRQT